MKIEFNEKILIKTLIVTTMLILLANVAFYFLKGFSRVPLDFVHVAKEGNFTAWFSGIILFIASVLAFQCASKYQITHMHTIWPWHLLSAFLLYLSIDEIGQVHDRIDAFMKSTNVSLFHTDGAWLYAAFPIVIPFLIFLLFWLNRVLAKAAQAKRILFIGLGVFFFGALGGESILIMPFYEHLPKIIRFAEIFIEEGMEMTGTIFMIIGLTVFLSKEPKSCA